MTYKLLSPEEVSTNVPLPKCSADSDRVKLKEDLIETMKENFGLGLSANQVGVRERVFIMYSDFNNKEIIVCFNPQIISYSQDETSEDEGCLTWPGLWLKVKRPDGIECQYEDEYGELQQKAMFGLEARIFQHEYDHMEGTDFTSRVSKFKLDRALEKMEKAKKRALEEKFAVKNAQNLIV